MSELVHEGEPTFINENEDIVAYSSTRSLIDELKKRYPLVLALVRDSDGEEIIDWGGSDFDYDYGVALCEKAKIALIDNNKENSSVVFIDEDDLEIEGDDDDEEDEFDDEEPDEEPIV